MSLESALYRKDQSGYKKVGNWRKARAIHNWFVVNVQGGVDNCQLFDVKRSQLKDLLNTCRKVLELGRETAEDGFTYENSEICEQLLPNPDMDYGDKYMESVEVTVKILEDALSNRGRYCYDSSW